MKKFIICIKTIFFDFPLLLLIQIICAKKEKSFVCTNNNKFDKDFCNTYNKKEKAVYEKENHSGIALCGTTAYAVC